MTLRENIIYLLNSWQKSIDCNHQLINAFYAFINSHSPLTKDENKESHVCCFFLPIHEKSKSLYLCHHKKANDWIPPGGHIKKTECKPLDTVRRECKEELDYTLTKEPLLFSGGTIKHIHTKTQPCKTHYDLWFIILFDNKIPFAFSKREFYDAKWVSYKESLILMKDPQFLPVLESITRRVIIES